MQFLRFPVRALILLGGITSMSSYADDTEAYNAKFQSTYVWQFKDAFPAAYTGANSLSTAHEKSYSFTATAAFGFRPWTGGEIYFNPELSQGVPLSNLVGLGGFTNGEMARTSGSRMALYRARLFLRQTWGMGGEREHLASDMNQLAGNVDKRRLVWTIGNLAVSDIFDDNAYSHDPRTQFMNWSIMNQGAFDYAADARGYSWGTAVEWYHDNWAVRAGRFIQPIQPNQTSLDTDIFTHFGDQIEVEHSHTWASQPGKIRVLAFRNRAIMSRYRDALNLSAATNTTPDLNAVRTGEQIKFGIGLNIEQAISDDIGLFARVGWADGQTETYAFTEIDQSISAGALIQGSAWGSAQDSIGLAFARNALSAAHRGYLAAGGIGFFIGDGKLNYQPELILEGFYRWQTTKQLNLTADWQHIRNPAYNADRGPVDVVALRAHLEF
ncbi:MAG: carbohydrate porin [Sulfuriferula sp.]|nr:carbohydrate porin [Sulfuriferula sp.]